MNPANTHPASRTRPAGVRSRGFSLLELLVVISIISVLLGIMLAMLPGVRDAARRTACSANLRSIGQSLAIYLHNNDDYFPAARYMPPPWLSGDTDPPFNQAIESELDPDSLVYRCPGDQVVYDFEYEDENGRLRNSGMSYTYIIALSGRRFEESFFARVLRRSPSDTPVLHDYDGGAFETQDGRIVQVDFFHSKRNVLYVDGHAGPVKD